jgi:hypothetical protein
MNQQFFPERMCAGERHAASMDVFQCG